MQLHKDWLLIIFVLAFLLSVVHVWWRIPYIRKGFFWRLSLPFFMTAVVTGHIATSYAMQGGLYGKLNAAANLGIIMGLTLMFIDQKKKPRAGVK